MGYTSDVTNTINGKKYTISTALMERRTGRWETVVLKRMVLGIPNMFRPMMRLVARNERQAQLAHRRVEEIVAQLNPTEWNSAKLALVNDDLYAPDAEPRLWESFRGNPNTNAVLEEKAKVVSELITMASDTGLALASAMKNQRHEIRLGGDETRQALAESAVFLLSVVDRQAFQFLGSGNRDAFMDALAVKLTQALREKGVEPNLFQELVGKRFEEYARYQKWVPEKDEGTKDTLFWEYAKKVSTILNVGPDAVFNVALTNVLLETVLEWKLNELLPEQV